MLRFLHVSLLTVLLSVEAQAATPQVKDHAHLFSPAAVQQATEQLQEIKRDFRASVVVETFAKVPFHRDPWRRFAKLKPEDRESLLHKWAQARLSGADSVYVFIFAGPDTRNVQVEVGRGLRTEGTITRTDRQEVRDRVAAELTTGHNNAALLAAVHLIRAQLETRLGGPVAAQPFDWWAVMSVILPLAGAWLVVVLVQAVRGDTACVPYGGVSPLGHGICGNPFAGLLAALRETKADAAPEPHPHDAPHAEHPEAVHEQHS